MHAVACHVRIRGYRRHAQTSEYREKVVTYAAAALEAETRVKASEVKASEASAASSPMPTTHLFF